MGLAQIFPTSYITLQRSTSGQDFGGQISHKHFFRRYPYKRVRIVMVQLEGKYEDLEELVTSRAT